MSEKITISVVVPLYNKLSTVERTIDSILCQRRMADEVIVVDDGSTDGSGDLIESKYPTVKVIRKTNGGVSSARNEGVYVATGTYIAFLDSDDWWSEHVLETFERLINNFKHAGMYTVSHQRFDGVGYVKKKIGVNEESVINSDDFISLYANNSGLVHSSSVCISKNILRDFGGFPECYNLGEDIYLWLSIALRYPVAVSPLRLVSVDRPVNAFGSSKGRDSVPGYINHFCNHETIKSYPKPLRQKLVKFLQVRGLRQMMGLVAGGNRVGALKIGLRILRVNWLFLPFAFATPLLPRWLIIAAYKSTNKNVCVN